MRGPALLFPLLILITAGCTNGAETVPATDDVSGQPAATSGAAPLPEPSVALTAVASLEGEWRVAGIDGRSLDEPYGIALSGNPNELWWEPRCAGLARRYRISGPAIAFGPIAPEGAAPGSPPPPVCEIGMPPRLADVSRALDAATRVGRTPGNGVLISGGGHSVTLFSQ